MSFINKKALFLLIIGLVFLPIVSFALTNSSKYTHTIDKINIGIFEDDTLDRNVLLGDLKSGDIVSIKWDAEKIDDFEYYHLKYGCSSQLDLRNDDKNIEGTVTKNILWEVPSKYDGCSKNEDCYCKIWIWVFNKNSKPIGVANSRPFRIWKGGNDSEYERGVVLGKVKEKAKSYFLSEAFISSLERKYGLKITYLSSVGIVIFENREKETEEVLGNVSEISRYLEYYEKSPLKKLYSKPNDTKFDLQYSLDNQGGTFNGVPAIADSDMDVIEAWDIFKGDKSMIVAVIDDGVSYKHEDLKANMWDGSNCITPDGSNNCPYHGWDFADSDNNPDPGNESHGTHIAGIIGAVGDNSKGVSGVNQKISIMALRASAGNGSLYTGAVIKGIDFAIKNNAKIINASFGSSNSAESQKEAINVFVSSGGLFIAAAGNASKVDSMLFTDGYKNHDLIDDYPCDYKSEGLICIAASGPKDERASFSDYGKVDVDIAAPGLMIYSTVVNGYEFMSGTSMATPNAAGAAALLWAYNPVLTNIEVKDILFETGDPLPDFAGKTVTGKRINLYNAIMQEPPEPPKVQKLTIVTESFILTQDKKGVTFKASAWIKETKPVRIEYWFEFYQRDANFDIINSTKGKIPKNKKTVMTKNDISSMLHIGHADFSAYTPYDVPEENTMCFIPYGKLDYGDEYPTGHGAELCFPNIPWVITKPASNISDGKADFNGLVTSWAGSKKLNVWFKKNGKDLEKKEITNTGDNLNRISFKDNNTYEEGDCYQACAQIPGKEKYNCGVEWCFPGDGIDDIEVETVKYKQTDDKVYFVGKIKNYTTNIIDKIHFGFKVYVKGDWPDITMDIISTQHNVKFDSNTGIFTIIVPNLVFEDSGYCFRAYVEDKNTSLEIIAKNEICSEGEEEEDDCNVAIVQAGASGCPPCQEQKKVMKELAIKYGGKLLEIDAEDFEDEVLENKKKGLFVYMDVDNQENSKLMREYAVNYSNIGSGIPYTIIFQDGKDVDGSYGGQSSIILEDIVEEYCPE